MPAARSAAHCKSIHLEGGLIIRDRQARQWHLPQVDQRQTDAARGDQKLGFRTQDSLATGRDTD